LRQFARTSALRATNEIVDQLQDQLAAERKQYAFKLAENRELAELRYQLAKRDREDVFAQLPSPSKCFH
jgi:hypothetical protein